MALSNTLNIDFSNSRNYDAELITIKDVRAFDNQARKHSPEQIKKIATSIETFGFLIPILIDEDNKVICGHGRIKALEFLGQDKVWAIRANHLSEDQKRAYVLADNRLAELGEWDEDALEIEIKHLLDADLDFEIGVIGFETAEIDLIIARSETSESTNQDPPVPEIEEHVVSETGDLWQLGTHRLYCGDALASTSYAALMQNEQAHMVFTDPPYNVPIHNHVCGKGDIKHREFIMASGEMNDDEFCEFLRTFLILVYEHVIDGSVLNVCMDWRHLEHLLSSGRQAGLELINLCIWNKDNGGMGSLYRSKHEDVVIFRKGSRTRTNNVMLGKFGRNRTNVWDYAGINTMRAGRLDELAMHPTVKPVALVKDAIFDVTHRDEIILDPFCGSGTTILSAEQSGRRCYAMELDPAYIDVAIRRYQDQFGIEVVHAETGMTFSQMQQHRHRPPIRNRTRDVYAATDVGASAIGTPPARFAAPIVEG
ncbi:MAG: ParB N-terminal domain-containing protein [Hyphomonadaceae bacterium]|nr:ParB N-terminal domain-containing protein [Hyphomonadaceae bacterium]